MFLLLRLAYRNIFRQRRRSLLTALSITGGYVICAFSFSLSEGSYANAIDIFTLDHTGHVQIHQDDYLKRPKIHKYLSNLDEIDEALDQTPGVIAYTRRIYSPALAYGDKGNTTAQVIGVDLTRERQTTRLAQKVTSGEYISGEPDDDGYYKAMIGTAIAKSLGIDIGDELILISQGADGSVANDVFKIGAIIGTGGGMDKQNVYLPLATAQEFLTMYGAVHEYALLADGPEEARDLATRLQEKLPNQSVAPWQVVQESFYKTMLADKQGNQVTLSIIIFIVFIGVLNTILMSVLERTREFGVLMAVGSRPATIVGLIFLETLLLSTMSIVAGIILSTPLILWFNTVGLEMPQPVDIGGVTFSHMTGVINLYVFVMPAITIFAFALVISIFPGLRAARVSPTAAMGSH